MGFLKKSNAPSELPDLAMDSIGPSVPQSAPTPKPPVAPQPVVTPVVEKIKEPVAGEDYLEVSHDEAKKLINDDSIKNTGFPKSTFFDDVLEDINNGIADVGKLEDWYEKKFVREDVVSNMKGYWEGNKADIIIQSFGAEYKRQIGDKVKILQELEEDWREIYFRLVKKEEEMKKEERELKETVSEFVNLCKRRKGGEK